MKTYQLVSLVIVLPVLLGISISANITQAIVLQSREAELAEVMGRWRSSMKLTAETNEQYREVKKLNDESIAGWKRCMLELHP